MSRRCLFLLLVLLAAPACIAQQGAVYSYEKGGVRYYTTKPPAGVPYKTINYFGRPQSPQRLTQARPAPRLYPYTGGCTNDCSGHEAGARWAERRGIEGLDDCSGNSNSFIEGCQEYAAELQRDKIQSGQCKDEDYDELCDY
ncbi:hypothetical protein BRN31_14925 [Xanthomonas oryzae pv. oryzae]|nr:hypothetical protein BRN31_14925 [Xanthomonas oryzae pv. oryzae]RBL53369.1 hypothetical protein BRN24_18615 [Xanthomonas oryzae pv. oryzae]